MKTEINLYQEPAVEEHAAGSMAPRDELVLQYAPLVRSIAEKIAIRLPPQIGKDDLVNAGIIGLLDAIKKYDEKKGVKFTTYAGYRIKGAILDELRRLDWFPRSVRKDVHEIEKAVATLSLRLGREPQDYEIAGELGIDLETYFKKLDQGKAVSLLGYDELAGEGASRQSTPSEEVGISAFEQLEKAELKELLAGAVKRLSKKEHLVISLYYYDELKLREIAEVMKLTEARVSQIHTQAIIRLRVKMRAYYEK